MKFWRLRWMLNEFFTVKNYTLHQQTLKNPLTYWALLVLKFFPFVWKSPVLLRLKAGGSFYVHEFMTLYIYKEIFVDKCYDFPPVEHPNPVIFDVGANTGLFAIRMKQLYPDAQLYCFEPNATNFYQLATNIKLSLFKNVKIFQLGVGGTSRMEKLYIHQTNIGGHSIYQSETNSLEFTEIELVSLNDLFKKYNIETCNLLKMDCEGAEFEIIKSLDIALASKIEKLIFEATPSVYSIEEIRNYLEAVNFTLLNKDGLCVAYNNLYYKNQNPHLSLSA